MYYDNLASCNLSTHYSDFSELELSSPPPLTSARTTPESSANSVETAGAALLSDNNVYATEDDPNLMETASQIGHLEHVAKLVHSWLGDWGGLDAWNNYLDTEYQSARKSGSVPQWMNHVQGHAYQGRLLARMLEQMELYIPLEMWKVREMWRQQTILVFQVAKALALIEVRLDLIRRGPFSLLSV